jgi:ribonuclease E
VDVNTGKFTGQGGNLEETVTRNNLEAAEEIVRQLRLRDVGGIIVIDFIDMVLESNRELVLRRLLECLARDRTKHQVAEVTSLGLVQMTRKRVGSGLLESFSETCECCNGRGLLISLDGVEHQHRARPDSAAAKDGKTSRDGKGRDGRRQRQGKADKDGADAGGKAEDKPAARIAEAPAARIAEVPAAPTAETPAASSFAESPATESIAAESIATVGTVTSGTGESGDTDPVGGGDSAAPGEPGAATGHGADQDRAADAAGNGAAAGQPSGGRRRRRAATREPGPPDAAVSTDGQAAPEASAPAGV